MPVNRPVEGGREIAMMEWGLIPFFSKDGKRSFTTFNPRAEELAIGAMDAAISGGRWGSKLRMAVLITPRGLVCCRN
jgi:hypothetical protein